MIHEQPARRTSALLDKKGSSAPANTGRCRIAIEQLQSAYNAPWPLVILAGHWASDRRYIKRNFLSGIQNELAFIRIDKSCSDVLQGMREVIRGTGFEPNDMTLAELDSMFENFLSYQLAQHRRTVLMIEETPDNNDWVRDKVRKLVELESDRSYGLMIILFRPISRKPKTNGHAKKLNLAPLPGQAIGIPRLMQLTSMVGESGAEVGLMAGVQKPNRSHNGGAPLKMILTRNGKTLREMIMDRPRLMIGRAEDNDVCINDSSISQYHALLVRFGDTAFVKDLNSKSGTYVNMSRIKDQMVIHQDILSIGNHSIRFIAPDAR